ncbi:sensor domain-containing diguanylate cyclase [Geobacter argillaceus]|uniref:diguanylate cyclase n=1 Tax=Geobacter argillaceus TaxID=345631 RepID=A0A562VMU5_9BACT|nr:diguanylate cyclase [Geobacter argillaceus]TWJ19229.1 PAS domain S-box-containing protein/diguanylate cyclase (GGDEF)-like protein [Geobacter argillaceus]
MIDAQAANTCPIILIVEDDPGIARLACISLNKHGFSCIRAANGSAAINLLADHRPTLLLLDYTLPDRTGAALVAELKELKLLPPFVIITGSEDTSLAVNMMKMGARDYLVKDGNFLEVLVPVVSRVMHDLETEARLQQAEAALRESEERLRSTLASLDDLIFVLDKNGIFIDFYQPENQARLFMSKDQFLGKAYWEVGLPVEPIKQMAKAIADVKNTNAVQAFDYVLNYPDGNEWYNAKVSMRRDPSGSFDGITIVSRNITERKLSEEKLLYMSTHDPLTGLFNRTYFDTELERLIKSRSFPVSIVMADVDGLKKINDTQGHAAGDRMLKTAATALLDAFRSEDVLARIGGDEFAVLLPNTDEAAAKSAVDRAKNCLAAIEPEQGNVPVSLSLGWATALKGGELLTTLRKADARMYRDKGPRGRRHSS